MGQILTAYLNAATGELSRPESHIAKLMDDGVSNVTQRGAQARKSGSAQPRSSRRPRSGIGILAPALERCSVGLRELLSWECLLIPELGAHPNGPGRRRQLVNLHGSNGVEAC
jgi:hypothetical protein